MSDYEEDTNLGENQRRAKCAAKWKVALKLSDKREEDWRKSVENIYKTYTPKNPSASTFNVLWANTETLRQAVYNSLPKPECSRRYADEDPVGKAASEVLTRALEFSQSPNNYDFDGAMKGDVMAMLLSGRGLSRVRYVPEFSKMEEAKEDMGGEESASYEKEEGDDVSGEENELISWERAITERVQWDDFRILSNAKTWDGVDAIAFRHCFTRDDMKEKFGDQIGGAVGLDTPTDEAVKNAAEVDDQYQAAEVWEIWDKCEKKVYFISKTYQYPLKEQDDPLKLTCFFPIPRPLYAIENDQTLVPAALFTQYEQQAKELNNISRRINNIVSALKVRGIYDSTIAELNQLMNAGDNVLVPAQNVTALIERGGLGSMIWMMPITEAAGVLQVLQAQREATKQVIYELTGISDIMRSATNAVETFGAQKLKTQWGTQRLQKMQREVQRYIADLVRLKAEIIAEKFQIETLQAQTQLKFPRQAEVEMQMMQYQQMAQQAQMQGQQPPPPPDTKNIITWEMIEGVLHDDATRSFKIDIETDSTISASQESDMGELTVVLKGIVELVQGLGPAVQAGAIPVEAVKEIILMVCRKSKMGSAVETALMKIQPPKPEKDPNAGKAQMEQMKMQMLDQQHQRQLQADAQLAQMEAELKSQVERDKQQAQAQQNAHQNEMEQQREMMRMQYESELATQKAQSDAQLKSMDSDHQLMIAQMNNQAKIEVAEIGAQTTLATAQISAAQSAIQGDINAGL
jgi:hypothetical protein